VTRKEMEKRFDPARILLTERFGGSNRMLPPSVRSIPERSNSSGITTGHVRWSMTGRSQSPVSCLERHVDRPDAEGPPSRT
jgi:hypothetical protein